MSPILLLGVRRPKLTLLVGLILLGVFAAGLGKIYKDTRADAFLAADNPAVVYKNKAREIFGISDPVVIAIEDNSPQGIYRPETLNLVQQLTESVNRLPNINEDRTMSLSTENNIAGNSAGLNVVPFMELPEEGGVHALKEAIRNFPLYDGLLVSSDGAMTLIIAELYDDSAGESTYNALDRIVSELALPDTVTVYTAGEGAVLGYLGQYIDRDASRLNPLAGLIITIMLIVAFRRFAPAVLGNLVIAAAVLMTIGIMGYSGVPFFVITNAMPVILIGIAVADSIHIFSHYYETLARQSEANPRQAIESAVLNMAWPVTLTTLTTMAGFLGLYASAYMPPFEYFGLFTALGVLIAWIYSLFVLPAAIVLLKPKVSQRWIALEQASRQDLFARFMMLVGRVSTLHPTFTVSIFAMLSLVGLMLTTQVQVNDNRIETFHTKEPLYLADQAINRHMEGTNTLDVVIEAPVKEGLFDPAILAKIEALQVYGESLYHINGSMSVADFLKQMNQSLNEDQEAFYRLPESKEMAAQFFLLYSASADPTDFENVVDYDYRQANVRFYLDTSEFIEIKPVVEALQAYVDKAFADSGATATLTGRVNLNYHWIKDIGQSHFLSVVISLICVFLVSVALFRSWVAGTMAVIPVVSSILMVYAAMVILGIDLGIGTSMFASVAIGLGVDFAIHTLERLRTLFRDAIPSTGELVSTLYATTGRALFFNYLAIAFGFGVLISSQVVPLNNFGTIVVLSVTMSFIASLALIPAMVLVFKPAFLYRAAGSVRGQKGGLSRSLSRGVSLLLVLALFSGLNSEPAQAETLPGADAIVANINTVAEGEHAVSLLQMTLRDKGGKTRERKALSYRKYFGEEKKTLLFYESPANVKGTAFLTYDYPEAERDDDQWLYLPALRKVRRISASDRGDYFLGTDFTYEDIKQAGKIEEKDFRFETLGKERIEIHGQSFETWKIASTASSPQIAEELGYQRSIFWVSPENWIVLRADYWDQKGRYLKTYTASDIRKVDGIWTKHRLEVKNHKTGHFTRFEFSDVDYRTPVRDDLFTRRTMERGL